MKNKKVCILNYGSGNVKSVFNMLKILECSVAVSNKESDISSATHIVLPGVGAFGSSMEKIKTTIPFDVLEREVLKKRKPFLGICVGMQVLADKGLSPIKSPQATEKAAVRPPNCVHFAVAKRLILC